MNRYAAMVIALGTLVASGLVHGLWAERWSTSTEMRDAAERVAGVPLNIGDWQGQLVDADAAAFVQAGAQSFWTRVYVHPRKKAALYVILMCGRSGKMAVHTPEVCYRGAGYELANRPETWAATTAAGATLGTFWTASFTKGAGAGLRLYWSWNAGEAWQAPANPRWDFGGEPFLYKLYLSYDAQGTGADLAAQDFVRQFLPQLQQTLSRRN